jgi:hypothetical protein
MARLPTPGGDENTWGDILNQFMLASHDSDGSLKPSAVSGAIANGSITSSKLAGSAVDSTKLANNAVTEQKIADGAVTHNKLGSTNTPIPGQVLTSDGTNLSWQTSASGVTDHTLLSNIGTNSHAQIDTALSSATNHYAATTSVHGIADTSQLIVEGDSRLTDARTPTAHNHPISDVTNLQTSLNAKADASSLSTVATSGSYTDLTNQPTIPTQASDIGAIPATEKGAASGVATLDGSSTIPDSQIPSSITRDSELSTVATSGSYTDLSNQPSIPSNLGDLGDVDTSGASDGLVLKYNSGTWAPATDTGGTNDHGSLSGLSDDDHPQYHTDARGDARYYTQAQVDSALTGKADTSSLSTVATTGDYNDLINQPTIPTQASDIGAADALHTHTLSDVTDSGTAAALDVAAVGDAAAGQVVKGDDSRLTNARTPTAHTHTESEITDLGNYADATHNHDGTYATAAQGALADTAVQPGDDANTLGSGAATDGYVLTADGAGGSAWEAAASTGGIALPFFSHAGNLFVGTGTSRWYNDTANTVTLDYARASVGTAPTGAAINIDINIDGTTALAGTFSIADGAVTSGKFTNFVASPDIAPGSYVTIDIDQVGSTVVGADLSVQIGVL